METSVNETVAMDTWFSEFRPLEDSCVPVIVNIEKTGLSRKAGILQVAAKCGSKNFEAYILPKNTINPKTSEITGFSSNDEALFYRGQKVKTIPSNIAARQFLDFLHELNSQILLVGHNIFYFAAPSIFTWLNKHGLLKELCCMVYGLTDTFNLLGKENTGKQQKLVEKYLVGQKWNDIRQEAHNATTNCILLEGLLEYFQINDSILKNKSLSLKDFFQKQFMTKNQRKNMPHVAELKPILSRIMLRRMARHGLTIDKLTSEYLKHGDEKIAACLRAKVNGKSLVTSKKRVIQSVINYIKKYAQ